MPAHANTYCVVLIPDEYGDYAVHRTDCTYIPDTSHCNALGAFDHCAPALDEARKRYIKVNACRYCVPECHRSKRPSGAADNQT